MIGRDFSDIYIAACGENFNTRSQGVEHERKCRKCYREIYGYDAKVCGECGRPYDGKYFSCCCEYADNF